MTPMEILRKIVDTENDARAIYKEVVSLRDGFDDYVEVHIAELKKKYFEQADREIAEIEEREIMRADKGIEKLDDRLKTELTLAKARYESKKEAIVLKIFKLAVNADA